MIHKSIITYIVLCLALISSSVTASLRQATHNRYPGGSVPSRTVTNTYDRSQRLLTETVTSAGSEVVTGYTYDKANNRTARTVTINGSTPATTVYVYDNNLNQLDAYFEDADADGTWDSGEVGFNFEYDANGNRVAKEDALAAPLVEYGYDFENRLVSVDDNAAGTFAYTYDYRTRRIVRDETAATIPGELTTIVFSGGTSVREIEDTATTVEYLRGSDWGGGVGGILYSLRSGAPSFSHANSRGDIVAKTNASGALTYQASYDAFGRHGDTASSAAIGTDPDRQKANSKDEDPTGLLNEGQRYRDLDTDTLITRDPLGFVDGPNVYAYVGQNPWTKFDPEGLFWAEFRDELYQSTFGIVGVGDRFGQGVYQAALTGSDIIGYAASSAGGFGGEYEGNSALFQDIATNSASMDVGELTDNMRIGSLKAVVATGTFGASSFVEGVATGNIEQAQDAAFGAALVSTSVKGIEITAKATSQFAQSLVLTETSGGGARLNAPEVQAQLKATAYGSKDPYGALKDPRGAGPGKDFTKTQLDNAKALNASRNGGTMRDDGTGEPMNPSKQSGTAPYDPKAVQGDHLQPKNPKDPSAPRGSNSNTNLRLRTAENNNRKSNR